MWSRHALVPFAAWGLLVATGSMCSGGRSGVRLRDHPGDRPDHRLNPNNPPDEVIESLENDKYYRWVTYAFVPMPYISLGWGSWMLSRDSLDVTDKIGLSLAIGIVAGIAINTVHEMGHKKEQHERWFARIALAQPVLWPLLHRTRPRTPRPRHHA